MKQLVILCIKVNQSKTHFTHSMAMRLKAYSGLGFLSALMLIHSDSIIVLESCYTDALRTIVYSPDTFLKHI